MKCSEALAQRSRGLVAGVLDRAWTIGSRFNIRQASNKTMRRKLKLVRQRLVLASREELVDLLEACIDLIRMLAVLLVAPLVESVHENHEVGAFTGLWND